MSEITTKSIKGFELLELIGKGAFGAVYRAYQPVVDREVAVKIILPEFAHQPDFIRRFESEAQLVAQLEHIHIVPLYDYWRDPEGAYLVMRLMKGGSLQEVIEEGSLSLEQVKRILVQVSSALAAAHKCGIVHRDLKPANILLDDDNNAYLSDFGIAKAMDESAGLTMTGAIVGSPAYITPEQVKSMPVSPQTDIYALGVMLYTMLAGQHPFPEASPGDLIARHLRDPLPPLGEVVPNLPFELDIVIQRATAKDPTDRYIEVGELVSAYSQAMRLVKISDIAIDKSQEDLFISSDTAQSLVEVILSKPPHNLPCELTPFVGRDRELQSLEALYADPKVRLVTIQGVGGMGKTRLAIAFGENQLDATLRTNGGTSALYPQGIFFIPLANLRSSDSILPTFAEIIGYRLSEKREAQNQLIDYLRYKKLLLIFDNCEHVLDGTGFISEILKYASEVRVLATSRTKLNIGGEHRFPLKGMDLPVGSLQSTDEAISHSSIELFLKCASRAQPEFELTIENMNHVAKICQLLQGMPLAIRMAASWIELLTPREILGEIELGLDLLETEVKDIPERHSNIRAVFEQSWNQLSEHQREILGGLSIFRGGFTRQAAEQVAGASLRELKTLVNKSLISPSANRRFEIHELLRQYIAEKLANRPEWNDKIKENHCHYFTHFLHESDNDLKGHRQFEVLNEIENDHANIQIAWNLGVDSVKIHHLYQMVDGLCRFYLWRRRFKEGRSACTDAEEMLSRELVDIMNMSDFKERQRLLVRVLIWHSLFCEYTKAKEKVDRALAILESHEMLDADTGREKAFAYQELGNLTIDYDREQAGEIYEKSRAFYESLDDDFGSAHVMTSLGWACAHKGDLEQSNIWGNKSLTIQRSIGDRKGTADTLWMLGTNAIICGFVEESVKLFTECLDIRQKMGDRLIDIASGPVDLGMTLTWIGRMEEAKKVRQETLAIYRDQGTKEEIATAYVRLAYSLLHLGEYGEVHENANIGLALGREIGNQRVIGLALSMIGTILSVNQSYELAKEILYESIANLRDVPGAGELGWVLSFLAYNELQRGEYKKAQKYLLEAFMVGRGLLATVTAWIAIPVYAMLVAYMGDVEKAVELDMFMSRYPISKSYALMDLLRPLEPLAKSNLPEEKLVEARRRGRERNLKDTIAEITAEIETSLDD